MPQASAAENLSCTSIPRTIHPRRNGGSGGKREGSAPARQTSATSCLARATARRQNVVRGGGKGHRLVVHDRHVAAAPPRALSRRLAHFPAQKRRPAHLRARTHAPRVVRISSERCSFSHVKSFVGAAAITTRIPEYEGLTLGLVEIALAGLALGAGDLHCYM